MKMSKRPLYCLLAVLLASVSDIVLTEAQPVQQDDTVSPTTSSIEVTHVFSLPVNLSVFEARVQSQANRQDDTAWFPMLGLSAHLQPDTDQINRLEFHFQTTQPKMFLPTMPVFLGQSVVWQNCGEAVAFLGDPNQIDVRGDEHTYYWRIEPQKVLFSIRCKMNMANTSGKPFSDTPVVSIKKMTLSRLGLQ